MNHQFTWMTGHPLRNGVYVVIDGWGIQDRGVWEAKYGWCIRGRWLGPDAARYWTHQLPMPTGGDDELRVDEAISQRRTGASKPA